MSDKTEKVTAILDYEVEFGHAQEGSEGNLKTDCEGGTASVARKGDLTKSGYFTFYPGGVSTINWWLNQIQVSKYSRSTRVNTS